MIRERAQQIPGTPHQRAAGLERRVQPLVRIDGHRIGLGKRAQARPALRAHAPRARRTRRRRETRRHDAGRRRRSRPSGSTAPVLTEPAVPTTRNGSVAARPVGDDLPLERVDVHPLLGRRRESIGSRRCRGRTDRRPSESTCAFRPTRRRAAALPAIAGRRCARRSSPWRRAPRGSRRSSPCCRRSPAARRRRVGNPISSAIQRTVCASISVAIGDSRHAPTFGLTADASRSPSAPIGAGLDVM